MHVSVQSEFFDFSAEIKNFSETLGNIGALVTFTGIVRGQKSNTLDYMFIEHYPGMTETQIKLIVEEAFKRWEICDVLVIHRYGKLEPGEPIMMVATAAEHRREAFEAAEYLMDYLKSRAPFWKKEVLNGEESWVEATSEDEACLNRWR
ncbi:MAG: molybdenum cofactor biosynthesis protein MoaE [Paracoccaceae bacterium]|nr:molybdenum cofactor biosynthesis protein MoaE [Paracoccaceae bacterium]